MSSFWVRPVKITYPNQIHLIENVIFDNAKVENYRNCPALIIIIIKPVLEKSENSKTAKMANIPLLIPDAHYSERQDNPFSLQI